MNLQGCWNASNHNLNYLRQVITCQRSILWIEIRELNLRALIQRRENTATTCKVIPPGADLAAPLGSQSYAKPKFMGPHNCRDGMSPDAMMKDFRALVDNTQGTTHRVAIYSGTFKDIKPKSRNKTYISDEQLHAIELSIYHAIQVQIQGLDGEHIAQMCRCTGSQSWRGGDRRIDWVWVKERLGRCYGALNGRLLWQPQCLFKSKLLTENGAFVESFLDLPLTTIPENSGNFEPVPKFVQLRNAPAAVALPVFCMRNVVSCAHVIPEMATSSKTGHRRNERWIVNSHIDLVTWNDVYN